MAVPSNGDIIKVTLQANQSGSGEMMLVHHFLYAQAGAAPSMAVFTSGVDNALRGAYANVIGMQAANLVYNTLDIFNVTTGLPIASFTPNALWNSGRPSGAEILPAGVAALPTWSTGFARSRGKKFLYGMIEANLVNGLFGSTTMANLALFAAGLVSALASGTTPAFSLQAGVAVKGPPLTFRPFITGHTTAVPAYQRRRKVGVGV